MNKLPKSFVWLGIAVFLTSATVGQGQERDISSVVAAGKVKSDVYSNAYLGITLTAPLAKFTAPSLVNVAGRRARLVNIVYDSRDGAKNYTIGLLADSLENYPKGISATI